MEAIRYKCTTGGGEHDGLRDLSFASPYRYETVPEAVRTQRALGTTDTCVPDDKDCSVNVSLPMPIRDTQAEFVWEVSASLSTPNSRRYVEIFRADPPEGEGPYFGWRCNNLPGYPEALNLETDAYLQRLGKRLLIKLESSVHPLFVHQRDGIPLNERMGTLGDRLHRSVSRPREAG